MGRGSIAIHPEAILEARAARVWYSARSPAAGRAFLEELDRAVERAEHRVTRLAKGSKPLAARPAR